MNPLHRIALASLAVLTATCSLHAQPTWDYNREAREVAVQPNKDGTHRIIGVWEYAFDTTLPVDISTTATLLVNGNPVWTQDTTILKVQDGGSAVCPNPTCPGYNNCGYATQNGIGVELTCYQSYVNNDPAQGAFCTCSGPVCTVAFDFDGLNAGDVIELEVSPASSGWLEIDTTDDIVSTTFSGGHDRWNRRIKSAEIRRAPGGPAAPGGTIDSFFDVFVEVEIQSSVSGFLDAGAILDLFVNGQLVDSNEVLGSVDFTLCPSSCSGSNCAAWYLPGGGSNGICKLTTLTYQSVQVDWCMCLAAAIAGPTNFSSVSLQPGDEIMVLLRPAPGALPELPPLPGTDEEGDDVRTPALPCPCDGDANGDGVVDVNDISFVLFRLGQTCFPL
jgi:hypothetical protein